MKRERIIGLAGQSIGMIEWNVRIGRPCEPREFSANPRDPSARSARQRQHPTRADAREEAREEAGIVITGALIFHVVGSGRAEMSARADIPLASWLGRGTAEDSRIDGRTAPPDSRAAFRERTDGMVVSLRHYAAARWQRTSKPSAGSAPATGSRRRGDASRQPLQRLPSGWRRRRVRRLRWRLQVNVVIRSNSQAVFADQRHAAERESLLAARWPLLAQGPSRCLLLRTVINLRTQDLGYDRDVLLTPIDAERPGRPPEAATAAVEDLSNTQTRHADSSTLTAMFDDVEGLFHENVLTAYVGGRSHRDSYLEGWGGRRHGRLEAARRQRIPEALDAAAS